MRGRLGYKKVLGIKNPADILTKHVPADLLDKHIGTLGAEVTGGRAATAPELSSVVESFIEWHEAVKGEGEIRRVKFAKMVTMRAIPRINRGRKCQDVEKMRFVTEKERSEDVEEFDKGRGNVKKVSAVEVFKRGTQERWADMIDE